LNEKELKDFLVRKRDLQNKLRGGLVEAARQFGEGKTRADLVTSKLPVGITEDDIAETMRANSMSRQQVLDKLGTL
jgi:hypothetical protein